MSKEEYLKTSLTAVILLLIGFNAVYSLINCWNFVTDDAFISWRYAEHLAQGKGLLWSFNQPPVEGYSNFSWLLLAFLFIKLGLPLIPAMKIFATACLFLSFYFLYRCARVFSNPLYALLSVYLFSCYKGLYWWTVSGLETSLFVALALLLTYLLLTKLKKGNGVWICISLLFLSLTRFEGILWLLFAGLYIICRRYNNPSDKPHTAFWKSVLISFVLPYLIYSLWRIAYFGQLLPNSYLCKSVGSFYPSIASFYHFLLIHDYLAISFPFIILGLPFLFARYDCRNMLLWLPSLTYAVLLWDANPIIAHYNRLFLPAFALICVLPPLGIQEFLNYFSLNNTLKMVLCFITVLLLAHFSIPGINETQTQKELLHYQQRSDLRMRVSQMINHQAQRNARILVSDCGIIPYFGRPDLDYIDSECLNNRQMTQHSSLENYALTLVRHPPDWIIYSVNEWNQANDLMEILIQQQFLKKYQLIAVYPLYARKPNGQLVADFTYRIYKRLPLTA
ncbi:protein LphB [Legionella birminghamensis]|uniref:Protein LphB n=1 Tax=Legionella birminghamensis TaxID=28083 RepID=A0A378IC48_9GAMM|nr:hypothetical protein [Legionella birminghamensis]KTC74289.1 protein LphB [Legionella birminghamensis]STX32593.1 protein LphB [Legionella birminghamensis]